MVATAEDATIEAVEAESANTPLDVQQIIHDALEQAFYSINFNGLIKRVFRILANDYCITESVILKLIQNNMA